MFGYRVRIENEGGETVQLLTRHWRITDGRGRVVEVKGEGVVGEQPLLEPGEAFQYTSGTPLPTPTGIMAGSYQMVTDQGERFDVTIPAFRWTRRRQAGGELRPRGCFLSGSRRAHGSACRST